jgi:flagellar assembly factor FliW
MKFKTTRFGEIEYPDDVVLTLPDGVLGFEDNKNFILLEHNVDGSPFRWLQALDNPDLAFIVVDPMLIDPRYQIEIDRDTSLQIGTQTTEDCAIIAIVNVPHDNPLQMTANLKAPIVINAGNRVGRQLVLRSNLFAINTPVFPAINLYTHAEQPDDSLVQRETASS